MLTLHAWKPLIPILAWLVLNVNAGLAFALPLRYRLWTLPAILLPAYVSFKTINYLTFPPGLAAVWGYVTVLGLFHFTSLLYIKQWTLRSGKDEYGKPLSDSIWPTARSWKRMYRITSNPRLLNTSTSDVNGMEGDLRSTFSSTKAPFSLRTICRCVVGWLIHVFIIAPLFPGPFMPMRTDDFAAARQLYFRRLLSTPFHEPSEPVTSRETLLRGIFAFQSFWTTVLVLETVNTVFAIFWAVVFRVSEPRDWPHLFGSPLEAYTLGRFWSRFWHRGHVASYLDFTQLLIKLLPSKLQNNRRVITTITQFMFFLFSGIVHALVSRQLGDRCAYTTDIWFYVANFIAVFLEGAVLKYSRGRGDVKPSAQQEQGKSKYEMASDEQGPKQSKEQPSLLWRCIGYLWVLAFFFWAVPKFYYPKIQCAIDAQMAQARMLQMLANMLMPSQKAASV